MSTKPIGWQHVATTTLALFFTSVIFTSAYAIEFELGELKGSFDSTISVGASWRVSKRDERQIAWVNGGTADSVNFDDGNLNFKRGETFSKIIKGVHELELTYRNFGAFVRGTYFYDFELKDENRPHKDLGKDELDNAGADIKLLDAFVWADFDLGPMPLNIRLGNQVVSWGESTFIQGGINTINPVDVSAFRKPGSELREGLVPVNMIYTSLGVTDNLTLEAFYQLDWERTEIDPCGTYFSNNDFGGEGCGPVVLTGATDDPALAGPAVADRLKDGNPKDDGQFGVALRWFAESLNDTEFGLYFINYHSRLPYVSGKAALYGPPGPNTVLAPGPGGSGLNGGFTTTDLGIPPSSPFNMSPFFDFPDYQVAYPEDIRMYGFSFSTSAPGGYSISGEVSYRPNMPLQSNSFELLTAGNLFPTSVVFDSVTPGVLSNGYERHHLLQGQITVLKFYEQVLGADRLTVIGEAGFTRVNGLPDISERRFGRSGKFGHAGATGVFEGLCLSKNPNNGLDSENCSKSGFADAFSWGYRMRAALRYNNAFAGVNVIPSLAWSHDVNGTSPDPGGQFIEGRKAVGLGVTAEYLNRYTANVSYTNFFGGGRFNELNDRDFISVNLSVSF